VLGSLGDPDGFANPEISPDGRRLAASRIAQSEAAADIWTLDLETGARKRITTAAKAGFPVWSRDGQRIAYQGLTGVAGNNNVYEVGADGATPPKLVVGGRGNLFPVGWLADARFVFGNEALSAPGGTFPQGFLIHEPDREKATPYRVGGAEPSAAGARLSPDAKRIVFHEIAFGGSDLFVDQIPSPGAQPVRVWHGQSQTARWSADGREVFFVSGNHLMAATISDGPILTAGTPMRLFEVPSAAYAVDPKTGRFLVMQPVSTPVPSITVTLNWQR
jgi:Tol biopolymer transport system component